MRDRELVSLFCMKTSNVGYYLVKRLSFSNVFLVSLSNQMPRSGVVVHTFKSSTWVAETGVFL